MVETSASFGELPASLSGAELDDGAALLEGSFDVVTGFFEVLTGSFDVGTGSFDVVMGCFEVVACFNDVPASCIVLLAFSDSGRVTVFAEVVDNGLVVAKLPSIASRVATGPISNTANNKDGFWNVPSGASLIPGRFTALAYKWKSCDSHVTDTSGECITTNLHCYTLTHHSKSV